MLHHVILYAHLTHSFVVPYLPLYLLNMKVNICNQSPRNLVQQQNLYRITPFYLITNIELTLIVVPLVEKGCQSLEDHRKSGIGKICPITNPLFPLFLKSCTFYSFVCILVSSVSLPGSWTESHHNHRAFSKRSSRASKAWLKSYGILDGD